MVTLVVAWRSQPPPAAISSSAAIAAVFFYAWPLVEKKFSLFCLLQETSVYVLLGLTFARSLRHQQVALCTQLAAKVHGPLSAQEVAYTRKITAAWSMFFVLIAVVSVLLYARTPLRVWSIYINFCVLPLICAMFIGEYLVRGKVLPTTQRVGWLASVRVYFAHQQ